MKIRETITMIRDEWLKPTGFLRQIRYGRYDPEGYKRLVHILKSLEVENTDVFDGHFVRITWFIPIYMEQNKRKIEARGENVEEYQQALNVITRLLFKVFGGTGFDNDFH